MALVATKNDFPPTVGRVFAASAARVLHDTDAPAGCKHLPAGVIFHAAGNFIWTDASGTTVTTVVTAESVGIFCPIAPAGLDATNAVACTVLWRKGPKKP
jgi:hypothetical protein